MPSSYLFYDLETSGLNPCFDQVLQFAAIRTDLNLKQISEHEIFIKLNPDVVPAPAAILTHQISLTQLAQGSTEYSAMREIHKLFNTPETISVGYNSLNFDDEFLRFSFYRNLLPPYLHQYANNCGRMDIYPIVVMYYLFKPSVLVWPKIAGTATLKLEQIASANNLITGSAHDALTDVKATVNLARVLMKERAMWDYVCKYFNKSSDLARTQKLNAAFVSNNAAHYVALAVDGSIGASNFYQAPVLSLGVHNHYKNQSLWLRLDNALFSEIPAATIIETTYVLRKRFGETPLLLPFEQRFQQFLTPERLVLVQNNISWLKNNPELLAKIANHHKEYKYPNVPNVDIDAALYQNGFLSNLDQSWCDKFHAANVADKVAMLEKFPNQNLRTQALRVLGRNFSENLSTHYLQEFQAYLARINTADPGLAIIDYRNTKKLSPDVALAEIEKIITRADLTLKQQQLLVELKSYLVNFS